MSAPVKRPEAEVRPHSWAMHGPGDFDRWTRYECKNCGMFAQFHDSYTIAKQDTKKSCEAKPSPESVARYQKNQEERKKGAK